LIAGQPAIARWLKPTVIITIKRIGNGADKVIGSFTVPVIWLTQKQRYSVT
jgi:hypothetical protein